MTEDASVVRVRAEAREIHLHILEDPEGASDWGLCRGVLGEGNIE